MQGSKAHNLSVLVPWVIVLLAVPTSPYPYLCLYPYPYPYPCTVRLRSHHATGIMYNVLRERERERERERGRERERERETWNLIHVSPFSGWSKPSIQSRIFQAFDIYI